MPPKRFDPFSNLPSQSQMPDKSQKKSKARTDEKDAEFPTIKVPEPAQFIKSSHGNSTILKDSQNYLYCKTKSQNGSDYYTCKAGRTNKHLACQATASVRNNMIISNRAHSHFSDPIKTGLLEKRAKLIEKVKQNPSMTTDKAMVEWASMLDSTMEAGLAPKGLSNATSTLRSRKSR